MKKIVSLLLMLVMCITLISPTQVKEAQAAEGAKVSTWAIPDLIYGDTYGIYPLTWYEKGVTGNISKGKLYNLYFGLRHKLVQSDCAKEKREEKPVIDNTITVKEVLTAYYILLSNYDYKIDLGLGSGLDPVTYMKQLGVYTGQNGEQGLDELCSLEQAMVMATRLVTFLYNAFDVTGKGFLWEVKSGNNTVYMLGSIHIASSNIYPFSSKLWQAFNNSNAIIGEVNFFDQAGYTAYIQLAYYTDGTTLKEHVSADAYQNAMAAAAYIGIPEETAAYLKPWALYLEIERYTSSDTTSAFQTSTQYGIDPYLETVAFINQKPIYEIEGLEAQGKILDSFSAGLQEYLLNSDSTHLIDIVNGKTGVKSDVNNTIDSWLEAWKTGNAEAFKVLTAGDEEEAFTGTLSAEEKAYQEEMQLKFITQRDDNMAAYVDNLLKSEGTNTYFVVVGAGHFISDYSVIDRLEKLGYEVNQIK